MAMLEIRGVHKSFHTYAKPGVHPGIFGRPPSRPAVWTCFAASI